MEEIHNNGGKTIKIGEYNEKLVICQKINNDELVGESALLFENKIVHQYEKKGDSFKYKDTFKNNAYGYGKPIKKIPQPKRFENIFGKTREEITKKEVYDHLLSQNEKFGTFFRLTYDQFDLAEHWNITDAKFNKKRELMIQLFDLIRVHRDWIVKDREFEIINYSSLSKMTSLTLPNLTAINSKIERDRNDKDSIINTYLKSIGRKIDDNLELTLRLAAVITDKERASLTMKINNRK